MVGGWGLDTVLHSRREPGEGARGGLPLWAWICGILEDPAFRYGLKFGIAGVAAVFLSLWARLDEPGWALFTVFVLMIAQYVGAIAEKSFFRLIGTVVGGVTGYLLTAAFEQNPLIYLPLLGIVVGTCTALFGQNRYPYAFLLTGMTTLVVAGNGMANPDNSWTFMLSRIEEIVVGLVVTMVVQGVLWPRYARAEFLVQLRSLFGDLRECLLNAPGVRGAEEAGGKLLARDFPGRISGLRMLLEFGARESLNFRRRLETYFELTVCLAKIAYAIGTLRESLPAGSLYRKYAGAELDALHRALAEALENLESPECSGTTRTKIRETLSAAFENLDARFHAMRSPQVLGAIPTGEALLIGLHIAGLDEIRSQIEMVHKLLDSLPEDPLQREFSPLPMVSPRPSPFWIKSGIKSGLAVMAAFLIDNWLNPPGGPMFILGTWVFTAMNAGSPGGQGDRRAFHLIPPNVVALVLLSLVLLAASPLLSSYAVMNSVLFIWLFVWGYLSFKTRGMTIPMQLAMLVLVGILGLNGQRPVEFQQIVDFFFGMVLALVLSALFQRLFWPSLPQWEIRDRFVEALGICRKRLAREELPLWMKTRLALIPGEVDIRLEHLEAPICPEGEPGKLKHLMLTIANLGGNLSVTLDGRPPGIPAERLEVGSRHLCRMEKMFDGQLEAIQKAFRRGKVPEIDDADIREVLDVWREWTAETRRLLLEADPHPLALARITGFAERYHLMGEDILSLGQQAAGLRLGLYMGDYSL